MAYEIKMPQLGLTMEEGTIFEWHKQEGNDIKIGDVILTIETDKLTNDLESEVEGTLLKIIAKEGETLPVLATLCIIGTAGEEVAEPELGTVAAKLAETEEEQTEIKTIKPEAKTMQRSRIRISPLAKKTAEKYELDYADIVGSGPNGRIIQSDILSVYEDRKDEKAESSSGINRPSKALDLMAGDEVVPIGGMRKVIAERMSKSHTEIPTASLAMKIDVTKLMSFRKEINSNLEEKLSVNDFVIKATAKALKKHQNILVSIDGDRIIKRAHVNIGMAVALEDGLIVPVIKDANRMDISELSAVAKELAEKARSGMLSSDDYRDSTITISNLGMLGVDNMIPVINQPNAAILGICAVQNELDLDENEKVIQKKVMKICMTIDHRLLDGAVAAHFLKEIEMLMEHPIKIII